MVQVQGQVILHLKIQGPFHFPGIYGFKVVPASLTDVHAILYLSFHLEISEPLLVVILAVRAFQAGVFPLCAANRAVEDALSLLPNLPHAGKSTAKGAGSLSPE
jgi:hypothetical protein